MHARGKTRRPEYPWVNSFVEVTAAAARLLFELNWKPRDPIASLHRYLATIGTGRWMSSSLYFPELLPPAASE